MIKPGCGACIGCGPGVSDKGDQVSVSAINRDYKGRSGPGALYLASPLTVADFLWQSLADGTLIANFATRNVSYGDGSKIRHDVLGQNSTNPRTVTVRSADHGRTWSWDHSAPMFEDGVFTTVWFADYGKDAERRPDKDYVYAYGLDGNWRDSFTDIVPDPTELFLARVPVASVQDRSTWEFYSGEPGASEATWAHDIAAKKPVLVDDRRTAHGMSVISQGGVTYLPKHDRYLYTSWTEYTFEFYESPQPWGPWTPVLSEDFGTYPWQADRIGGYATTVPSKFVSDDEKTAWVQSNVCPCAPAGVTSYWFGLREMRIGDE